MRCLVGLASVVTGVGLAVTGCAVTPAPVAVSAHRLAAVRRAFATVDGVAVALRPGLTVAAAAQAAHLALPYGALLSVLGHHVVDAHGVPPQVLVDGHPASLATTLRADDAVLLRRPAARVEPTTTTTVVVPPAEPVGLYVGARDGLARIVRGAFSGAVLATHQLRAPRLGRLAHPGTVTLTFDDGPYLRTTTAVLALLRAHHVHAVFCEIGARALADRSVVRRVVAAGDVLCDHTAHHYDDLDRVSTAVVGREVRQGYLDLVRASGGVRPKYFRAPQARWTVAMWHDAAREHLVNLHWTVDPHDWARLPASTVVAHVLASLRPGGIVLLHDRDINGPQTLAAVRQLLRVLPELGYTFTLPAPTYSFSLADALAADRGTQAFSRQWQREHPGWRPVKAA